MDLMAVISHSLSRPLETFYDWLLSLALQTVCDEIMDARGQDRFVVRGDDYLDGDDGEDEEFFADGGALTQTEAVKELSADELIKQRDADRQMSLGLLGWVKSWVW